MFRAGVIHTIFSGLTVLLIASAALAQAPNTEQSDDRGAEEEPAGFVDGVRPILVRHCFRCHGPDKAEAGLRLDLRSQALRGGDSGAAIQPGVSRESLLVSRVTEDDPETRMPLKEDPLSQTEIDILRRWIDAGADWPDDVAGVFESKHWSFQMPVRPTLPSVRATAWPQNEIDHFVLAQMEKAGLSPSPDSDRYTLIRRVYFDLIGLPPSVAEADQFVSDSGEDAYERMVDRVLASPHYGERWAREWLDLARYADTNGYEKDRPRSVWPYRDWVIAALNDDMPFDKFTIDQIAGDMLSEAGISHMTATGFHRNTMVNEEGGIDPQEDRFKRVVDRVNTTGTTWLGLTIGCAQCHSHKYDPISQHDFYQFYALLNNADEIRIPVPVEQVTEQRAEIAQQIAAITADLENRFSIPRDFEWVSGRIVSAESDGGATMTTQPDGSILVTGVNPEKDVFKIVMETDVVQLGAVRLETLTDPSLPQLGPGRAENGNFVISEIDLSVAPADGTSPAMAVPLKNAMADFSQDGFSVGAAIDGTSEDEKGWAIYATSGAWNVARTASFEVAGPLDIPGTKRVTLTIRQRLGRNHTLGRFRLLFGSSVDESLSSEKLRHDQYEKQFARWINEAESSAREWSVLYPEKYSANAASLTVLDDGSVLAGGDVTKHDVYEIEFETDLRDITALRLEALPHASLPGDGPGREAIDNEGDFFLSEIAVSAGHRSPDSSQLVKIPISRSVHSFAGSGSTSANAFDGNEETAWTITGGHGQSQQAIFSFEHPISGGQGTKLKVALTHFSYYPVSLGRFRISVTNSPLTNPATVLPSEIESLLGRSRDRRTPEQQKLLREYYLSIAPELATEHSRIAQLRKSMPSMPTTLVMQERSPNHARVTHVYERGEFLKRTEIIANPDVPDVLPPLPDPQNANRLALAHWLVDRANPLTARVVMNRHWAKFFGRGLVSTTEDFGTRGEPPTHPELLDWLAIEFMDRGWSVKAMHRLIVTSRTYRQSSRTTPEAEEHDPQNRWLSHSPRLRVDAEAVRDAALSAAGLLNPTVGGPSVFPPQPAAVTASAFGGLQWTTETDSNRYRRGLYTFAKRTAPYAAFVTFDAPSHESCTVRRERSNTPLQALTMMNDVVFVEASQALARRVLNGNADSTADRLIMLFRHVLTRPPTESELDLMQSFLHEQGMRFHSGELNSLVVAGGRLKRWDFAETAEDWAVDQESLLTADSGMLRISSTGKNPRVRVNIIGPTGPAVVRFRARCHGVDSGRVCLIASDKPEVKEAGATTFKSADNEWHEYLLDIPSPSDFVALRFEPGNASGVVEIDWFEVCYSRLPQIDADLKELAVWTALSRVILNLDVAITRE